MASNSKRSRDDKTKFTEAEKNWNLEKLYEDLRAAKQRGGSGKRKVLTEIEKCHLRGLLCGYSPEKIAKERGVGFNTMNTTLSTTLYRYIEELLNYEKKIKHWGDVLDFLEKAKYKIQVSEQFNPSHPLSDKKENTLETSHQEEGKDLIFAATSLLDKIGFDQKFKMNRTSQYTGYRLKNPGEKAKSYLLVLAQCKEGLSISISKDILIQSVLELKFYDDVWVTEECKIDGYSYGLLDSTECQECSCLYWVIPSKEDIFFKISQDYKDIFSGESTGSFSIDPKGIDTEDVIIKGLQKFKLKRSETSGIDWHFDHGELLARLDQSDCCISMNNIDRLFPHTRKVYINSWEILEEFIHYFGEVLIENY